MSALQVDPDELRTGATKTKATAPKMTAMSSGLDRGARQADRANAGYLTGEASQQFADRFDEAMTSIKDGVETQSDLIKDAADAWSDADEAVAKDFKDISSSLDR